MNAQYEPRRTFQSLQRDTLTKVCNPGKANLTVHYHTNGTGRDQYIVRDNGGFSAMHEPVRHPEVGSFVPKRRVADIAPQIHAKPMYYHSNGTGRDSYIVYAYWMITDTSGRPQADSITLARWSSTGRPSSKVSEATAVPQVPTPN